MPRSDCSKAKVAHRLDRFRDDLFCWPYEADALTSRQAWQRRPFSVTRVAAAAGAGPPPAGARRRRAPISPPSDRRQKSTRRATHRRGGRQDRDARHRAIRRLPAAPPQAHRSAAAAPAPLRQARYRTGAAPSIHPPAGRARCAPTASGAVRIPAIAARRPHQSECWNRCRHRTARRRRQSRRP